jgi:hypothetical protein
MNAMTMTCRAVAHDYTRTGIYHITLHVAEGMGQPLGQVVGDESAPDGSPDAPRTVLSAIGRMVEQELLHSIHSHYAMITVQDYVVMPDHLHFLLVVQDKILSGNGKTLPLGQVIAGFKKGCNKRFWAITGQTAPAPAPGTPANGQTAPAPAPGTPAGGQTAAHSVPAGSPGAPRCKTPSNGTTGRPPLFAPGFCDVMPVDAAQLATQRQYIKDNPRSRLLRSRNRAWLSARRAAIVTALTPSALRGYLQRECPPSLATAEALAAIEARLLIAGGGETAAHAATQCPSFIACDCYGNGALFTEHRCLPVICHRKDKALFAQQKARCLEEAARGTVLVSPRIAKGEQEIIDEAVNSGFPVVLIADNGFPPVYHPSAERIALCAEGRLLLITPWQYQYRGKNEQVTVPFCKTMNCMAQALCRTKDSWWKTPKQQ